MSEGSGQNLFLVRDGVLYTPPLSASDPAGHHARHDHHAGAAISASRCAKRTLPREMLYIADEVFFCGTAAEITPIRSIDKIPIGTAAAARSPTALQQALLRRHQRRVPDRHGWLTSVYRGSAGAGRDAGRTRDRRESRPT